MASKTTVRVLLAGLVGFLVAFVVSAAVCFGAIRWWYSRQPNNTDMQGFANAMLASLYAQMALVVSGAAGLIAGMVTAVWAAGPESATNQLPKSYG